MECAVNVKQYWATFFSPLICCGDVPSSCHSRGFMLLTVSLSKGVFRFKWRQDQQEWKCPQQPERKKCGGFQRASGRIQHPLSAMPDWDIQSVNTVKKNKSCEAWQAVIDSRRGGELSRFSIQTEVIDAGGNWSKRLGRTFGKQLAKERQREPHQGGFERRSLGVDANPTGSMSGCSSARQRRLERWPLTAAIRWKSTTFQTEFSHFAASRLRGISSLLSLPFMNFKIFHQ